MTTTSLPARLHSDFLDLITVNPFHNPGVTELSGTPIDIGKVDVDAFVVSGVTDHITPWKSVYQTAELLGDKTTFVLSNAGHLQSLLNPPGNPKATLVSASPSSRTRRPSRPAPQSAPEAGGPIGASGCRPDRAKRSRRRPAWAMRRFRLGSRRLDRMSSNDRVKPEARRLSRRNGPQDDGTP